MDCAREARDLLQAIAVTLLHDLLDTVKVPIANPLKWWAQVQIGVFADPVNGLLTRDVGTAEQDLVQGGGVRLAREAMLEHRPPRWATR